MKASWTIEDAKLRVMKIRWTRNSVRFRITPSELLWLMGGDEIVEHLTLPGGSWQVEIVVLESSHSFVMQDTNQGNVLQLVLTENELAELAAPENEGVYFSTDSEPPIRYFIEKDFPCAHPRAAEADEPATETFIAPPDFEQRKQS